MEKILIGAGLNKVANIDLAVLVDMVIMRTDWSSDGVHQEFQKIHKKLKRKQLIIHMGTSVTCEEHKESMYKSTEWS